MDWRDAPPYGAAHDDAAFFVARYHASCHCGRVRYEARADPVDAKLCHCAACQRLHGAPFQWAVIFHKADVRFTRGLDALRCYSAERDRAEHLLPCKLSCSHCGAPLADEGRRMFLAFGPLFDFGQPPRVPAAFRPSCHIFYGARVIDVDDGLPKFLGHKGSSPLWCPDAPAR